MHRRKAGGGLVLAQHPVVTQAQPTGALLHQPPLDVGDVDLAALAAQHDVDLVPEVPRCVQLQPPGVPLQ